MKPSLRQGVLIGAVLLVLAVAAFAGITYMWNQRLHRWIAEDNTSLAPYSTVLFAAGTSQNTFPEPHLDAALTEYTARNRMVLEMTRSEYHFSPMGREAWVKIHLVTGNPKDSQIRARIKLLNKLHREKGEWKVASVHELALP